MPPLYKLTACANKKKKKGCLRSTSHLFNTYCLSPGPHTRPHPALQYLSVFPDEIPVAVLRQILFNFRHRNLFAFGRSVRSSLRCPCGCFTFKQ